MMTLIFHSYFCLFSDSLLLYKLYAYNSLFFFVSRIGSQFRQYKLYIDGMCWYSILILLYIIHMKYDVHIQWMIAIADRENWSRNAVTRIQHQYIKIILSRDKLLQIGLNGKLNIKYFIKIVFNNKIPSNLL